MNLNQSTLIQFENERWANNYFPPDGSNSFYTIGGGTINLFTRRIDAEYNRFNLFTQSGQVCTGNGNFIVSGDEFNDRDNVYDSITIIQNTSLVVNDTLSIINSGILESHGVLELEPNSKLIIHDGATVTMYIDSTLNINDTNVIDIDNGGTLYIYGTINISLASVNVLLNNRRVVMDPAAVINITDMNLSGRDFSITDYEDTLRDKLINANTQGEINYKNGRLGYTWTGGATTNPNHILRLSVLYGEAILGDFKLAVLGFPEADTPEIQTISDLYIKRDATLYIAESYNNSPYVRPELYLGMIIGNNKRPGMCTVDGDIIVDGKNALITLDRGAIMYINEGANVYLQNGSKMRCTNNDVNTPVLFINGTLMIDDISQIDTFAHDNIVIGSNGRVIVLNPDTGVKRLLWSTPNGINETDLYRLFQDRIDHVEYHISNNTGIAIDQYYDFYAREFINWYGNRRIEKAIHDGILVWHDGGFIELRSDIIPWVNKNCTLLQASRLFKTFGSYDEDKLQDCTNRLVYAGCGDILFRFIDGETEKEILMPLKSIHMKNVINKPMSDVYKLATDNDGKLFLRNKVPNANIDTIVNNRSQMVDITNNKTEFQLP